MYEAKYDLRLWWSSRYHNQAFHDRTNHPFHYSSLSKKNFDQVWFCIIYINHYVLHIIAASAWSHNEDFRIYQKKKKRRFPYESG